MTLLVDRDSEDIIEKLTQLDVRVKTISRQIDKQSVDTNRTSYT